MANKNDNKSLVNKLKDIVAEIGPVQKKGKHPQYAYTTAAQVLAEVRHRLSDRGIFLKTDLLSKTVHFDEANHKGIFAEVETEHTFIDTDSGETLAVKSAGVGWDMGDKGIYKAKTGALKNCLMDNFLITDETEPESGDQAEDHQSADKPKGVEPHRRTKPYEEQTGDDDKKVAGDLIELKAYLTQHKIPDGFLLRLLEEKKLIDGHTKTVAAIKPGILRRVLSPKSLENLLTAWKQQQADEDQGSQTEPERKQERHPFNGEPEPKEKEAPSKRKTAEANEYDQTRKVRQPVDEGTDVNDLLEQEGYENWREVEIHFGQKKGHVLGKLKQKDLAWWCDNWIPKPYRGTWDEKDLVLDAALCLASAELGGGE